MESANATQAGGAAEGFRPRRVAVGSSIYNEIAEFLHEEAYLLDDNRLQDWSARLAKDLRYTAPLRHTRHFNEAAASVIRTVKHFDENYASMMGRIMRLTQTKSAWAEDPPSRTRRLITNIMVDGTDKDDEYAVTSYILMTRSRFEEPDLQLLSAIRYDTLRRTGSSFELAKREIIFDTSVIGMPNLAVFF